MGNMYDDRNLERTCSHLVFPSGIWLETMVSGSSLPCFRGKYLYVPLIGNFAWSSLAVLCLKTRQQCSICVRTFRTNDLRTGRSCIKFCYSLKKIGSAAWLLKMLIPHNFAFRAADVAASMVACPFIS